jgi:S-adenosylmethionine/arginine decarboxylase-like enzyme
MLPLTLSKEQTKILNFIKKEFNVIVDSCAGTGKTTLILSVARELPNKKLLQMTYNSMLKHEVRERVKKSEINNLSVHTFPERNHIAFDLYTCKHYDNNEVYLKIYLELCSKLGTSTAQKSECKIIDRYF